MSKVAGTIKMRIAITVTIMLSMMVMGLNAQDSAEGIESNIINFSHVEISAGKGAVLSGMTVTAGFTGPGNWIADIQFNPDNTDVGVKKILWGGKIIVGPHVGAMMNLPYGSIMTITNIIPHITTLHWQGVIVRGEFGGAISFKESPMTFSLNKAMVNLGDWQPAYTHINFAGNIHHVMGVKYTCKINKNFSGFVNLEYDFSESTQLMMGGLRYTP